MRILVVGSINIDLVTRVDHVPAPGEDVRGEDLRFVPGGKGANQAVACARLGAETVMLGRVGDDPFGRRLRDDLARAGVGVEAVRTVPGCASGAALILVDAAGDSSIVITPGANARLTAADVEAARPLLAGADAVVVQLEIPPETVARTVRLAREVGTRVVVDAGPPRRPIDEAVFEADVLTPNEAEAAALLDLEPGAAAPEDLACRLAERARGTVVLKAGAAGCVLAEGGEVRRVPAFPIEPVAV